MPGLSGWLLGGAPEPSPEAVPGVRNGRVVVTGCGIPWASGAAFVEPAGVAVAYWGEFYDPEFERCETPAEICAALIDLLSPDPEAALAGIDGSFVLFFQTARAQWLAADRTSSRPLYYADAAGRLVFAPELKAFPGALRRDAMVSFLVGGHPLGDATYIEGVRLLRPGSCIRVGPSGHSVTRYTTYVPAAHAGIRDEGEAHYRDGLAATLRAAVRKRRRALEAAVVPISGGYDSRGLLGCLREFHTGTIQTVSWGTGESDPEADAAIGRRVAEHFATDHIFLRRDPTQLLDDLPAEVARLDAANDDPFFHHNEPALIRRLRADMGRLVLFRGDECFGYRGPASSSFEALARVNIRDLSQFPDLQALFRPDVLPQCLDAQRQTIQDVLALCPDRSDWTAVKDWFYIEQRLARSLNFSHYAKLCFLEARNPWLDRDVLAYYSRLPVHYRYDKLLYRRTLEHMFPDVMARIPIASRNSLEDWPSILRTPQFAAFARKHLVESPTPLHEFLDPSALAALIDRLMRPGGGASTRVRWVERQKAFLRRHAAPVYRLLKKKAGQFAIRELPPDLAIGRLLVLKLWCDQHPEIAYRGHS